MSTSLVHVLKVIGPTARSLAAECDRIRSMRVPRAQHHFGSEDWAERDHRAIDAVCEAAVRDAHRLPFVFAVQYLDSWSVAGSSLHWFDTPTKDGRLWSDNWLLWYHLLPDRGWLARRLAKGRLTKAYRRQAEDRWVLDQVHEAANYCAPFNQPALMLVLSHAIGGSRMDEEYRRCLLDVRGAGQ